MNEIISAILQAVELIIERDPELIGITRLSLYVSLTATLIASLISIPIGGIIYFYEFRGKRTLINLIQTLYSVPTVLVGLFLFLLISQQGPFGFLNLLFTPTGMIIGQTLLILPILIGFTITALVGVSIQIRELAISLGASTYQTIITIIKEARYAIMSAVILGFGRAISEVGVAILIGGNIRGFTRNFTTAISLETSRGNLVLSIALGFILLSLALLINLVLNYLQGKD
ncbi:tungstate transport system permease protein [Methanosarcina thermophila]|uniref:Tungstate transport system permease protein n=3 Tax=Methanosarcina thermophila TaxID=2210 RepID=A0A1I7AL45_METTE|nr:ABC transporter permease [Methanosarcina thermophila]ALK05958.1 MAG: ABC transporter permease [Methanosarcina sp. 795]AKB12493.1 ABC-type tungstate transport system, permease protein [Methanosarcina thermophila TM-1]AKB16853.1 ABC-type tungstate transport system, permease protein [Methanosarcina thermophila CHTI-55]NLU56284.1 ABC transporter permease [Methanosarcina thermophila]SFT75620.1 tungstate transport system permease protein [Methanosarcina thermophila]